METTDNPNYPDLEVRLARLKEPFELDEIELLPKYTGQKVDGKIPASAKKQCAECGGYHGFPCIHLSYVGHAGITMRLNEVDPAWTWRPMAYDATGNPALTSTGLWAWMTVLGRTLPAFGDAQDKTGPNAVKEMIGDMIRNGAMRFGCGTYLWSKSDKAKADLTRQGVEDDEPVEPTAPPHEPAPPAPPKPKGPTKADLTRVKELQALAELSDAQVKGYVLTANSRSVTEFKELTPDEVGKLIAKLEKLAEKKHRDG